MDVVLEALPPSWMSLYIDSRTRPGLSGSPVIACRNACMYISEDEDGGTKLLQSTKYKLLGIYSGRINKDSDLGFVWKLSAVQELVEDIQSV